MARIDLKTSQIGSFGTGDLQLQNGVAMDATLRLVTDAVNTASPLRLSTTNVTSYGGGAITSNTAYGDGALDSNTTGSDGAAFGASALTANTTGASNTGIGHDALFTNSTGSFNTALGKHANRFNLTGTGNTGLGALALRLNSTGTGNTGVGYLALENNTNSNNTALGYRSLTANVSGNQNSGVGVDSLLNNTSGIANTAIGYATGGGITTGNYNTILGANVTGLSATLSNNIIIADGQGNRRINIDSVGNVGIGTTAPTSPLSIVNTIALAAGATNPRIENIAYTINNSGAQTGTATGIFLNATETALNGQTHYLMDLQVGGVSRFSVLRTGQTTIGGAFVAGGSLYFNGGNRLEAASSGVFTLINVAGTDFNRLQFGGTTSSFPSLKRNGIAIDVRLADDSGFATLNCGNISAISGGTIGGNGGTALGVNYGGSEVANNGFYGFSSTTTPSGIMDSNISRISAGLIGIGTGTTSNVLGGISLSRLIAAGLPTTRPATVGEFYQDTAANILANGDKVVGIRQ
jgi:hypothetical protein